MKPPKLEPLGSFAECAPEWARIALDMRNPFVTPEWASLWWHHLGRGRPLHLFACLDPEDDRLVGFLPLYTYSERPARVLRFVGHGPADELGPVCAEGDRDMVALGLAEALRRVGARYLLADQIPADAGWEHRLGGHVLRRESAPVLRFSEPDWDGQTQLWSSSVRRKLRTSARRLDAAFDVRHRRTGSRAEVARDIELLMRLHSARWAPQETRFAGPHAAFHRDFAAAAFEQGWLQLSFLELDGIAVAGVYNLRYGRTELQYQQGREPALDSRSVGFVALLESIRRAHAEGSLAFRFGRGDEAYKARFATHDPGLMTLAVGSGALAAATLAAVDAAPRRLLDPVRHRLRT